MRSSPHKKYITNSMFNSFYHQFERSSEEQFRLDFGTYPPSPLQDARVSGSFTVVHTSGLGALKYYWRRSKEYVEVLEHSPDRIAPDILKELLPLIDRPARSTSENDSDSAKFHSGFSRAVARTFFISKIRIADKKTETGLGYVPGMVKQDRHIRLMERLSNTSPNFEPTVSHEHIHILQAQNTERRRSRTPSPELICTEEWLEQPVTSYHLERKELEARLHELVVHYYRREPILPLTLKGLRELIASVRNWTLGTAQTTSETSTNNKVPLERSILNIEQFFDLYSCIKDETTKERFIFEVIAVMYGNLLGYYGSPDASANWHSQIQRPNLYDELYPLIEEDTQA